MNKTGILTWAVVLLVALNLSIVGTMVYRGYQEKHAPQVVVTDGEGKCALTGCYFRDSLSFDGNQMQVFREANRQFRPKANCIIGQIDSLKNEMFAELGKQHPDTVRLNTLAGEVGDLHTALKKETNRFYLKIKQVCTPQQLENIENVFSPLYCRENCETQGGQCRMQKKCCGTDQGKGFRDHKIHQ